MLLRLHHFTFNWSLSHLSHVLLAFDGTVVPLGWFGEKKLETLPWNLLFHTNLPLAFAACYTVHIIAKDRFLDRWTHLLWSERLRLLASFTALHTLMFLHFCLTVPHFSVIYALPQTARLLIDLLDTTIGDPVSFFSNTNMEYNKEECREDGEVKKQNKKEQQKRKTREQFQ